MKILHINHEDAHRGAARMAYRLHHGLLSIGVNSSMLVAKKITEDATIIGPEGLLQRTLNMARPQLGKLVLKWQQNDNSTLHSMNVFPSGLHRRINATDVDVVHLHWINGEMMSIPEVARIQKPIVWTFHDMWAFSGAEHVVLNENEADARFRVGYRHDNRNLSHKGFDIDRWIWLLKKKYWHNKRFQVVTPSRWLGQCVRDSFLMNSQEVTVIPNGIDVQRYRPMCSRSMARDFLGLPQEKSLILFGAIRGDRDPNKGFSLLRGALQRLIQDEGGKRSELVVFGANQPEADLDVGMQAHYLGHLYDDLTLAMVYTACDVMVVPSLKESFHLTALEAMACGTPVVAFAATGLLDLVKHQQTGYLARPYEVEDLAAGIAWVLNDRTRQLDLSEQARHQVVSMYDICDIARKYLDVYKNAASP